MENDLFMETVLDSEAIKKLLPHRYPFLFVDRIIELKPLERIVGIKQVSINESFFQGHFPGAPVMPGVVVIEALAQCGAILALREARAVHRHQGSAFSPACSSRRHSGAGGYGAALRSKNSTHARRSKS